MKKLFLLFKGLLDNRLQVLSIIEAYENIGIDLKENLHDKFRRRKKKN